MIPKIENSVFSETILQETSKPKTFEEINNELIKTKGFLLKLTNEERAEAIRLGFKLNSDQDVDKFKKWYEKQTTLSFLERLKAVVSFIFSNTISDALEYIVVKQYVKKQEKELINKEAEGDFINVAVPIEEKIKELDSASSLETKIKERTIKNEKTNYPVFAHIVYVEKESGDFDTRLLSTGHQADAFSSKFKGSVPTVEEFDNWFKGLPKGKLPGFKHTPKPPVTPKTSENKPKSTRNRTKTVENAKKNKKNS